jgi:type IV pilus assembly protein PilV
MKTQHTHPHAARGFSLIEVMVAVVVICIGLLGIAKMQAMALSNTNMSRQRSLAAMEAASFASAMHSNREFWGSFTLPFDVTIVTGVPAGSPPVVTVTNDPNTPPTLQVNTAAYIASAPAINQCVGNSGGAVACTNDQLAAFDLARWWANSVSPQLPNPKVEVNCPAAPLGNLAPTSCTVQIGWSEQAVAMNAQEAAQEAANAGKAANETPLFTLYVEP